jgi:hypothetical protein
LLLVVFLLICQFITETEPRLIGTWALDRTENKVWLINENTALQRRGSMLGLLVRQPPSPPRPLWLLKIIISVTL